MAEQLLLKGLLPAALAQVGPKQTDAAAEAVHESAMQPADSDQAAFAEFVKAAVMLETPFTAALDSELLREYST